MILLPLTQDEHDAAIHAIERYGIGGKLSITQARVVVAAVAGKARWFRHPGGRFTYEPLKGKPWDARSVDGLLQRGIVTRVGHQGSTYGELVMVDG